MDVTVAITTGILRIQVKLYPKIVLCVIIFWARDWVEKWNIPLISKHWNSNIRLILVMSGKLNSVQPAIQHCIRSAIKIILNYISNTFKYYDYELQKNHVSVRPDYLV